jgi:hypothetical protein
MHARRRTSLPLRTWKARIRLYDTPEVDVISIRDFHDKVAPSINTLECKELAFYHPYGTLCGDHFLQFWDRYVQSHSPEVSVSRFLFHDNRQNSSNPLLVLVLLLLCGQLGLCLSTFSSFGRSTKAKFIAKLGPVTAPAVSSMNESFSRHDTPYTTTGIATAEGRSLCRSVPCALTNQIQLDPS